MPVVSTVAILSAGADPLLALLDDPQLWRSISRMAASQDTASLAATGDSPSIESDHVTVRNILQHLGLDEVVPHTPSDRIDRIVLHPVIGPVLLALVLFLVFQAVFAWAEVPMTLIETAVTGLGDAVGTLLSDGWLKSLIVDGVIAGAGGVLVFLPQIVILYLAKCAHAPKIGHFVKLAPIGGSTPKPSTGTKSSRCTKSTSHSNGS